MSKKAKNFFKHYLPTIILAIVVLFLLYKQYGPQNGGETTADLSAVTTTTAAENVTTTPDPGSGDESTPADTTASGTPDDTTVIADQTTTTAPETTTPAPTTTPETTTPAPTTVEPTTPSAEITVTEDGEYSDKEHVALYIHTYGKLPSNYITKKDAEALGWVSSKGNLWTVAPGKSIGGSNFGNYEGLLPKASGRQYYECDIDYAGKKRNAKRIVFSNDGLIYYTEDHYASFELLYE